MIIDFSIENFRSVRTIQTLSMHVENPKQHLASNVSYPAGDKIGVLRTAGIYGANASGKSNILLGLRALRYIACDSGDLKDGTSIPCYESYRLSDEGKTLPVRFEIEFFNTDKVRYIYVIAFNQDAILEESLDFYPSKQKANIFKRNENDTWETIRFGGLYKGGTKRIPFFRNNSYLSKAGESAGSAELIRSVYKYFRRNVLVLPTQTSAPLFFPPMPDSFKPRVEKLLCYVDTGISGIETKINETPENHHFPENFPAELKSIIVEREKKSYLFAHKTEQGTVELFDEEDESEGTQKLFQYLPVLLQAFQLGQVVIVDELDASFHPHIADLVIKLFNDPEINTNNAQLIFSTHNLHLMSPSTLRRDQIWFTEKTNGETKLYSLDQFDKSKVKSDSPFENWYDEGRFGAIPKIDYAKISELIKPVSADKVIFREKSQVGDESA